MKRTQKFTYICCRCNNETDEYPSNSYCKKCGNEDDFEEVRYRPCPGCESEDIEQHIPFCINCFSDIIDIRREYEVSMQGALEILKEKRNGGKRNG